MIQITSTYTNFMIILNKGYPLMSLRDLNNSNTRTIFGKSILIHEKIRQRFTLLLVVVTIQYQMLL